MDKMREEFEDWYSDFGGYGEAHKKEMWDAWKASRSALRVELPNSWISSELGAGEKAFEATDVMISLDEAGVSYK